MHRFSIVASLLLSLLLLLPASAAALEVEIVNQSGKDPEDVWITVDGASYDVPSIAQNTPVQLSSIAGQDFDVNTLVSGRVYVSYDQGVPSNVPFDSETRFDWVEFTVTPSSSDVANLTAVDQFGIGMRLDTFDGSDTLLETLSSANTSRVWEALEEIPGGSEARVTDSGGNTVRILSPLHTDAYPELSDYVRSMSGKTITLRTAFFGSPFTTSDYSGTFAADGSITLTGTTNPGGQAPASIPISGSQLISDIYTGGNTPNTLQGAIYRDLLAGFSTGLWGGKYGNNALSFCTNPMSTVQGSYCPNGFNQPAFGDARSSLAPYATCEQYAAVINEMTDAYGNPYSDASKKVQISVNQPGTGGDVEKLRVTILPDSGNSEPIESGNPNCGAQALSKAGLKLKKKTKLDKGNFIIGSAQCPPSCGLVEGTVRVKKKVIARISTSAGNGQNQLTAKLTRPGKKLVKALKRKRKAKLATQATVELSNGSVDLGRVQGKLILLLRK